MFHMKTSNNLVFSPEKKKKISNHGGGKKTTPPAMKTTTTTRTMEIADLRSSGSPGNSKTPLSPSSIPCDPSNFTPSKKSSRKPPAAPSVDGEKSSAGPPPRPSAASPPRSRSPERLKKPPASSSGEINPSTQSRLPSSPTSSNPNPSRLSRRKPAAATAISHGRGHKDSSFTEKSSSGQWRNQTRGHKDSSFTEKPSSGQWRNQARYPNSPSSSAFDSEEEDEEEEEKHFLGRGTWRRRRSSVGSPDYKFEDRANSPEFLIGSAALDAKESVFIDAIEPEAAAEERKKKKGEEWMVDYALRQAVEKLVSDRKQRVELLAEAFEAVAPPAMHPAGSTELGLGGGHGRPLLPGRLMVLIKVEYQ